MCMGECVSVQQKAVQTVQKNLPQLYTSIYIYKIFGGEGMGEVRAGGKTKKKTTKKK